MELEKSKRDLVRKRKKKRKGRNRPWREKRMKRKIWLKNRQIR